MRFMLALLAVMALIVGPAAAAATRATCRHDQTPAMAGMDMAAMQGAAHAPADPRCDPGAKSEKARNACAQACAAANVAAISVMGLRVSRSVAFVDAPMASAPRIAVRDHRPPGFERPPKSIA